MPVIDLTWEDMFHALCLYFCFVVLFHGGLHSHEQSLVTEKQDYKEGPVQKL